MEKRKSEKYRPVIALIALTVVVGICLAFWLARRPETSAGEKVLSIQVIHGNGSVKDFVIQTEAEYLAQALLEHEPLGVNGEEDQFGLYIQTVDGETASDAERTFWSISKDGVALTVGASSQPVADGDHYELTLTKW